ncbi:MAG: hypothetical protein SGJ10_11190 [Bacteroidota bacterium]|nr:hypothetical protein [Bacteroidota bacterium]
MKLKKLPIIAFAITIFATSCGSINFGTKKFECRNDLLKATTKQKVVVVSPIESQIVTEKSTVKEKVIHPKPNIGQSGSISAPDSKVILTKKQSPSKVKEARKVIKSLPEQYKNTTLKPTSNVTKILLITIMAPTTLH